MSPHPFVGKPLQWPSPGMPSPETFSQPPPLLTILNSAESPQDPWNPLPAPNCGSSLCSFPFLVKTEDNTIAVWGPYWQGIHAWLLWAFQASSGAWASLLGFTEVGSLGGSEVTFSVCQGSTALKAKGLWLHLVPTRTRLVVRAPGGSQTFSTVSATAKHCSHRAPNIHSNHGLCPGYLFCPQ